MKAAILIIFTVFINLSCITNSLITQQNSKIIITKISYGEIPPKYDKKILSKITHVKEKEFSSGISGSYMGKVIDFPINDKLFNHEYFNNYHYDLNKKAILHLQKYVYNKEGYLVAIKIEDVK